MMEISGFKVMNGQNYLPGIAAFLETVARSAGVEETD
jgi:hypothetical protein